MKAPKKIWINPSMDLPKLNGVIDKDSIQYVRKDVFIDKACEWLKSNLHDYAGEDEKRNIVPFDNAIFHDFKKAMEE